jgi:hypothetical protein
MRREIRREASRKEERGSGEGMIWIRRLSRCILNGMLLWWWWSSVVERRMTWMDGGLLGKEKLKGFFLGNIIAGVM